MLPWLKFKKHAANWQKVRTVNLNLVWDVYSKKDVALGF